MNIQSGVFVHNNNYTNNTELFELFQFLDEHSYLYYIQESAILIANLLGVWQTLDYKFSFLCLVSLYCIAISSGFF